ncbi:hypothetical protein PG988_010117 [Apiospora saccharicola]
MLLTPSRMSPSGMLAHLPLLKLPLEARLMIYEFAVEVDEPINPIQLGDGSNKFKWDGRPGFRKPSSNLTVTELARTCRMVYHDLEAKPVFYRTNTFRFTDRDDLHSFLAAITPARRGSIRRMEVVHYNGPYSWNDYGKVMPLLLQCHDLRQLSFQAENEWGGYMFPFHFDPIPTLRVDLDHCLEVITGTSYDDPNFIMNVPGFQLVLSHTLEEDVMYNRPREAISITIGPDWDNLELQGTLAERVRQHFAVQITKIGEAMAPRKVFLNKHDIAKTVNNEQLNKCIGASGVHFAGEERVHLNRLDSDIGSISSRTRHRCNTANLNASTGRIERPVGNYDPEGVLVTYFTVHDIRRIDSGIECKIRAGSNERESWEPLHTLMTFWGLQQLQRFYRKHMTTDAAFEKVAQNLPPPRDIANFVIPHNAEEGREQKRQVVYQREWAKLQAKYDARIERLASKDSQKASQAQNTAEKTKKKATKKTTKKTLESHTRG